MALCLPSGLIFEDQLLRAIFGPVILLCLLGGERRWIQNPVPVLLFGLVVGPVLFLVATLGFIRMAVSMNWQTFAVVRSLVALAIIGPALDEVLATLQYLKRRWFQGSREESAP